MNEFHEEDEEYFCRFTFGQFVSLALLEIVALFFVFYLGARYGPSLMGREESPRKDHLSVTEQSVPEPMRQAAQDVKYTFPEQLTQPDRPVVAKKPTTNATVLVRPKTVAPPPTAERVAPDRRTGYSIQVGSYRQAGGAAAKVNQWQAKGYDAFLSIGEIANSGTWYRVRIGNFRSRDSARKFLDQLSRKEKVTAIIVRSNT